MAEAELRKGYVGWMTMSSRVEADGTKVNYLDADIYIDTEGKKE